MGMECRAVAKTGGLELAIVVLGGNSHSLEGCTAAQHIGY
jgi:hypothetical protein